MANLPRRTFIKGLLLATAGTAYAAQPQLHFPTDPRSRIGVATYPFRAFIDSPHNHDTDPTRKHMDLAAFAQSIPKEFGVHGIEPLDSHFASTDPAYVHGLRAAFDAAGVRVINIPVDVSETLCSEDPAKQEQGFMKYRQWIDTAIVLGSPSVRFHIPRCHNPADLTRAARAFRKVVAYATSRNILINLENDDPVLDNADRIVAFIKLFNSPYVRGLPDFANSLGGGDEAFNTRAVTEMFQYATNIAHVKDGENFDGKIRHVDLKQLFGIAKAANYRGAYSMESDSEVDPYVDTKHLIEQTLSLI